MFHGKKIWLFGDHVDTDQIISTQHYIIPDKKEMATHAMEFVFPDFASHVCAGDVIVGGKNFGCGSSREQAVEVFKTLGISVIVADSFARIFYRNCINVGLPIIECEGISFRFRSTDFIHVDISKGEIYNTRTKETFYGIKIPNFLLEIIQNDGLINYDLK
jgi:3-isopropylmalate/(R)-2-methylmalate dehydratase small subunit